MIETYDSFLRCIIAVHVTYTEHKAYFEWFSQIISLVPSILSNIEKHTMQDSAHDIKVYISLYKNTACVLYKLADIESDSFSS